MQLKKQLIIFLVIGVLAAIIHVLIVWLLVHNNIFLPLQANIVGFLSAVNVSYFGHLQFTFNYTKKSSIKTFIKFFSIATTSFLINQIAYFYGLKWFGQAYYLDILMIILIVVALFTFLFSKFWVFAKNGSDQ